jgi:hypothetical protein
MANGAICQPLKYAKIPHCLPVTSQPQTRKIGVHRDSGIDVSFGLEMRFEDLKKQMRMNKEIKRNSDY